MCPGLRCSWSLCDDQVGSALIRDPRVNAVILTGATDTARLFQRLQPGLHLLAETGGKNAYIVSAMSDRDQAIADVGLFRVRPRRPEMQRRQPLDSRGGGP